MLAAGCWWLQRQTPLQRKLVKSQKFNFHRIFLFFNNKSKVTFGRVLTAQQVLFLGFLIKHCQRKNEPKLGSPASTLIAPLKFLPSIVIISEVCIFWQNSFKTKLSACLGQLFGASVMGETLDIICTFESSAQKHPTLDSFGNRVQITESWWNGDCRHF